MHYQNQNPFDVPEATARLARKTFRKGNVYLTIRDELGVIYRDSEFEPLFSHQGRAAESPGNLALVLVMQQAEGLTDRQAAEAVRSRIDWKYLLGLALEDEGFDDSVLSEFRSRLIAGSMEQRLLNDLLVCFQERRWLKGGGKQRTDSTHVLAAVRQLNRLEMVGETMRQALEALAIVSPSWLLGQVTPDWFDRYGARFEQYRLPQTKAEQEALAARIGRDGWQLLQAISQPASPEYLREIEAVVILCRIWEQQYQVDETASIRWRSSEELAPGAALIQTPYDIEARYSRKREVEWTGYKVHLTETCDSPTFNAVTHVVTTPASTPDVSITAAIHQALVAKELAPDTHVVDEGYTDADLLVSSAEQAIELLGPVSRDTSWQAQANQGYALADFTIQWAAEQVICPEGKPSRIWSRSHDTYDNPVIHVQFAKEDCRLCPARARCTRAKTNPRALKLRLQPQHLALHDARQRQHTEAFKAAYAIRAGVEGTISLATRSFNLRRSRYIGLAKTHLHHLLVAAAMNLTRCALWLQGQQPARTRRSHFARLALST